MRLVLFQNALKINGGSMPKRTYVLEWEAGGKKLMENSLESTGPALLLMVVFTACGGRRAGNNSMQILTAYFSVLVRVVFFVPPPLEDCLTGLVSSTQAGTGCTNIQLIDSSVVGCQALT